MTYDIVGPVYTEKGDFARAEAAFEREHEAAVQLGEPTAKWFATFPRAGYAHMRGDLEQAERLAEEALQIGQEAGEPDAIMFYGAVLTEVRVRQGRGQEI